MKQIDQPEYSAQENRLLRDLSFIKAHRRYPLRLRLLLPFISIVPGVYVLLRLLGNTRTDNFDKIGFPVLIISTIILIVASAYIRQLKFTSIRLPYDAKRNAALLKKFLQEQHLAFYQLPDAPEIFQIISRERREGSTQEVVVFIADDNRILVNSHFTKQRWGVMLIMRRYGQLVRMLREWIARQPSDDVTMMRAR